MTLALSRPLASHPTVNLYETALMYAARGWCILPVRAKKQVALKSWKEYKTRLPTNDELKRWFSDRTGLTGALMGMAVLCGQISDGLNVRDFDTFDSYRRFSLKSPHLAKTLPTVATARGFHVFIASSNRRIVVFNDGELRGGGIVCLPPTKHDTGIVYKWTVPLLGPLINISEFEAAGLGDETTKLRITVAHKPQASKRSTPTLADAVKGVSRELGLNSPTASPCRSPCRPEGERGNVTDTTDNTDTTDITESSVRSVRSVRSICNTEGKNKHDPILNAIKTTIPLRIGQRHHQVFKLVRALKGIPEAASLAFPELKPFVKQWHAICLDREVISTTEFEETWSDFIVAWPRVPAGKTHLDALVERLREEPPPPEAGLYESPQLKLLIALCAQLQKQASPEEPDRFFLDHRNAGRLVGVDTMTAWRWMKMLQADGLLTEVEKGKNLRATRWKWKGVAGA